MNFWDGLKTPWLGLKVFQQHASVRKHVYLPFFLTFVFFVLGIALFLHEMPVIFEAARGTLMKYVEDQLRAKYPPEIVEVAITSMEYIVKATLYVTGLLFLTLCLFIFSSIACSIFWDLLAEEVFHIYLKQPIPSKDIWKGYVEPMMREISKQMMFVSVILVSYLVAFVPFIGPLISLIAGPVIITIWFSILVCDYWMNAKAMPTKSRYDFYMGHLMYLLGMGTYISLPIIGFVFYPFFVIGAAYQAVSLPSVGGAPAFPGKKIG